MTEIARTTDRDLSVQMDYARAVTTGSRGSSILPDAYKDNPANALIAIGLGQAMGLTPAESLYRIAVIKGKPSASAELIAANVRRAGHRLRIQVQEEPPRAVATIIRADDPDEPVTIVRDMAWANRMGLANEANYKKQPATMLSYRAITAAARLACPEALYGVSYTPDEAREVPDERAAFTPRVVAADFTPPAPPAPQEQDPPTPDTSERERPETDVASDKQQRSISVLLRSAGVRDKETAAEELTRMVGRPVTSTADLTSSEAAAVEDELSRGLGDS